MGRFLLTAAAIAACAALPAGAQQASTIAGAAVAAEVRGLLATAGAGMGMVLSGNTDNIATVEYWGNGTAYAATPGSRAAGSKVTDYHVSIDYSPPPGMRVDFVRDGQRRIEAVTADSGNARLKFAWDESQPGGGTITPAMSEGPGRWRQFWTMTPHGVIKAAVNAGSAVTLSKAQGGAGLTFPFATGSCRDRNVFGDIGDCQAETVTFTVAFDPKGLLQKVEVRSGAVVMETTYAGYTDLSESKSGKLFPSRIVHSRGGIPVWDLTITKADLDYPSVLIVTPPSLRTVAKPAPRAAP